MFGKLKKLSEKIKQSPEFSDISNSSIRDILGGDILNKNFVKKQFGVILLLSALSFFYIGNRFHCEKQLAQIDKLQNELKEAKYTSLTISCQLMTLCRQSQVEGIIKDKGIMLQESTTPPYKIAN
jgi:hypothetical protein